MGDGNKRNKPCWCGSGRKYKNCHQKREIDAPVRLADVNKSFKKAFNEKVCLAPSAWHHECTDEIVRAHTVPRSSSLSKIARDNHVYGYKFDLHSIGKQKGILRPALIGLREASTFRGFCSRHDDSIFSPVEKQPFEPAPFQCFLVGFRAIAKEQYTKAAAASLYELRKSADRGRTTDEQHIIQTINYLHHLGEQASLRDSEIRKKRYDEILNRKSFSRSYAYVFELDSVPKIMCSGGWFPEKDFYNYPLQDLFDLAEYAGTITCSVFATGSTGFIVFQWTDDAHIVCSKYIESFILRFSSTLPRSLVKLIIESIEGVYFSPDWWENLDISTQNYIVELMAHSANPFEAKPWITPLPNELDTAFKIRKQYSVGY